MNEKLPTILILGKDGMVGHTLFKYFFNNTNHAVYGTSRKKLGKNIFNLDYVKNSNELSRILKNNNIDYVINCIAELKNSKNADFKINYQLPIELDKLTHKFNFKLIHISTDDVFPYLSNVVNENSKNNPASNYGHSKLRGETKSKQSITIRTSFLGVDKNKKGLLELINKDSIINGFTNQNWSGCTTLQFAKFCEYLTLKNNFENLRKKNNLIHFAPLDSITKFRILKDWAKINKSKTKVIETTSKIKIDRNLKSLYLTDKMLASYSRNLNFALKELYIFEKS